MPFKRRLQGSKPCFLCLERAAEAENHAAERGSTAGVPPVRQRWSPTERVKEFFAKPVPQCIAAL